VVAVSGHPKVAVGMVAPYGAGLAAATAQTMRKGSEPLPDSLGAPDSPAERLRPLPLIGAFGAMHLGWGLGFLEGYLLRLAPAESSSRDPKRRR
jgi:succinoglycan biosynthesis protein ExoA